MDVAREQMSLCPSVTSVAIEFRLGITSARCRASSGFVDRSVVREAMCFLTTKSELNGEFPCASGNPIRSSTSSASSSSVIATSASDPCPVHDKRTLSRRPSRFASRQAVLFCCSKRFAIRSPYREWPQRTLRGTEITEIPYAECALFVRGIVPERTEKFNFIKKQRF